MVSNFSSAEDLIKWAFEAIEEARVADLLFRESNPLVSVTENDSKTGHTLYKYVQVRDVPSVIGRKVTEAVNNTRNAFDQIIFAACAEIGKPVKDAHYPWADSLSQLDKRLAGGKKGPAIPCSFHEEIRRQKPYITGDASTGYKEDFVREMSILANRKHTIGTQLSVGVSSSTVGFKQGPGNDFVQINPTWDPVKKEIIVMRTNGPMLSHNTNVQYCVGLSSSRDINGKPAVGGATIFAERAQEVLELFKAECAKINAG